MTRRRLVRVAQSFFDHLDQLLPEERTSTGRPSATDFLVREIPTQIDLLAEEYERVTQPVAPGVRVLIVTGTIVAQMAIYTVVAWDGAIEIVGLELDEVRLGVVCVVQRS
jgi:hypothetical protein